MQDISFEEMAKHFVQISSAITHAREELIENGMTWINSDMHEHLKRAQDEVDILRNAIRPSRYKTTSGETAHGYLFASYKLGQDYYGHANFGHLHCGEKAQERTSIPLEEYLKFLHDTPPEKQCSACGNRLLPEIKNDRA